MNTDLRQMIRTRSGRDPEPSLAIADSQRVKITDVGGEVGYAAGKQVDGRTRHILVDTLSLLLVVVVSAASVQDASSAPVLEPRIRATFPRLQKLVADAGDTQQCIDWFARTTGWLVEIVQRAAYKRGVQVLPKRWIVARTFKAARVPRHVACRTARRYAASTRSSVPKHVWTGRCQQRTRCPLMACNTALCGAHHYPCS